MLPAHVRQPLYRGLTLAGVMCIIIMGQHQLYKNLQDSIILWFLKKNTTCTKKKQFFDVNHIPFTRKCIN